VNSPVEKLLFRRSQFELPAIIFGNFPEEGIQMKNRLRTVIAALAVVFALSGAAWAQSAAGHLITANGRGEVFVQPDLGILILEVQSSSPLAADALREEATRAANVQSALEALGYIAGSFKLSPVVFTRAGGAYYGPNQPSITGIQAEQFVYIFFGSGVLKTPAELGRKVAAAIDALIKSGAAPANPFPQQAASMVVYTVRDPSPYENQALQQAVTRARETAETIAKGLGVQLSGLQNASTFFETGSAGVAGGMLGTIGPFPQAGSNAVTELPYRFYSVRSDQVAITASATLRFGFR
jgi:uncharacterized protein YggE